MIRLSTLTVGAALSMWLLLAASLAQASTMAVDRVSQFQSALIASPVMGLPSAEQLDVLAPYLSEKLLARLQAATLAQQTITRRALMPEPPVVQGALFYSLFEGAARLIEVVASTEVPNKSVSSVLVTVQYLTQPSDPAPVRWTDRVMLGTENQQVVIDDVQYLGQWDFSRKGTLTELLDTLIAAGQ